MRCFFYITTRGDLEADRSVGHANRRCYHEKNTEQLNNSLTALRMALNSFVSNLTVIVIAALSTHSYPIPREVVQRCRQLNRTGLFLPLAPQSRIERNELWEQRLTHHVGFPGMLYAARIEAPPKFCKGIHPPDDATAFNRAITLSVMST